jgi:5'-methylthioadenosine phosphorylase
LGALGLILGTTALTSAWAGPAGDASDDEGGVPGGVVALQRHGRDDYRPPHLIDHAANLRLLADRGCDRILGISSVGSLREDLGVGSFLCPDDFIALSAAGSIFEDAPGHVVPGFDGEWRRAVIAAWQGACDIPLEVGGVYWQARGPRFETPAEIRLVAPYADVIGMTVASESVAATELGLPYAAVCVIDNVANGIGSEELTVAEFERGRDAGAARLAGELPSILGKLAP